MAVRKNHDPRRRAALPASARSSATPSASKGASSKGASSRDASSTPDGPARASSPHPRSPEPSRQGTRSPGDAEDVAVVCGISPDGAGLQVLRKRGEQVQAGTVRRLEQGKPILGELVRLTPRADHPLICDVEVEMPSPTPTATATAKSSSGPAQVANDRYRKNWDAIYKRASSRPGRKSLPN